MRGFLRALQILFQAFPTPLQIEDLVPSLFAIKNKAIPTDLDPSDVYRYLLQTYTVRGRKI